MENPNDTENRGTAKPSLGFSRGGKAVRIMGVVLILAIGGAVLLVVGNNYAAATPTIPESTRAWPTLTARPTATPEACSPGVLRPEVGKVDALMLEFYDWAMLAEHTPRDQLVLIIPSMQEVRRRAEAQQVSPCLDTLKSYQISYMNMVIHTCLAFVDKSDPAILVEGINQSIALDIAYREEKARVLGEEYVPPPTPGPTPAPALPAVQPSATQ
jgi:hypothetical protein